MTYFENLKAIFFDSILPDFNSSAAIQRLNSGSLKVEHYKSYLKQTYHYTKNNPQIQALATVYFRGSDRDFVNLFYKHALSEIGHDLIALKDFATLGGDIEKVKVEYPLPATIALNSFVFWQIYNHNPIGYLGYLFFLEFLPTSSGNHYMKLFEKMGVPRKAMRFIEEHTKVDVGHNKLMEKYAASLIKNDKDFNAVVYALRVTSKLFSNILDDAFKAVDKPENWGIDYFEFDRLTTLVGSNSSVEKVYNYN